MAEPIAIVTSVGPPEPVHQLPCGICRRQFSKYTCRQCNVPYCSLTCFRSEVHSDCSEAFYKREIESDIRTTPSKSVEEQTKMMDLLKRFEENSAQDLSPDADQDLEPDDDDDDDLAKRLGTMNLEQVDPDELWSALNPAERARFEKALRDPSSDLAQQLLSSTELEEDRSAPWWEAPRFMESVSAGVHGIAPAHVKDGGSNQRYGAPPEMLSVPAELLSSPLPARLLLLYNLVSICIVYAHVTRIFSVSSLSSITLASDAAEARRMIGILVPFVVDRRSKIAYASLEAAVTDLWSRFGEGEMNSRLFALLAKDAARFLRPILVTELWNTSPDNPITHPSRMVLLVISDLRKLFNTQQNFEKDGAPQEESPVSRKLAFYAAQVMHTPASNMELLCQEVDGRAEVERLRAT